MRKDFKMILVILLFLAIIFGGGALISVLAIGAAGFLFVFGDLIVFIAIIVFIIKKIRNRKK